MRLMLWLVLVAACEKSGPVESSSGTSSTPREPEVAKAPQPASVGTLPHDAGVPSVRLVDAAVAKATPDAKKASVSMDYDDAKRFADQLVSDGPDPVDVGDMSRRRPGADLGRQLDDVRDDRKKVAVIGGGTRGGGDPRIGTGGGAVGGSGTDVGGKAVESGPPGRISVSKKQAFDDTTLSADMVLAKIQSAYFAGLKRCYKNFLKKDATARGKVALMLTVNEVGRAVNGRAKGFVSEIDDCITGMMANWRFPVPKDADGEATDASFEIHLQLVPD